MTFHSLRATHATMFMIQGGTLRETMGELGHVDVDVAVRCYQRVVPRHRRDVVERLALEYLPAEDPAGIKAQIAQKEEEIDQLRQTVAGPLDLQGQRGCIDTGFAFVALSGWASRVLHHLGRGRWRGGIQVHHALSFLGVGHTMILSFGLQENVRSPARRLISERNITYARCRESQLL